MNKRVLIVGTFHFPNGTAPASRINNIAKGFVQNDYKADVVALFPPPNECIPNNLDWKFLNDHIKYKFIEERQRFNNTTRKKINWFFQSFKVGLKLKNLVEEDIENGFYDVVFFYGRNFSILYPLFKVVLKTQTHSIIDIVELPKTSLNILYFFNPTHLDQYFGVRFMTNHADRITVITKYLANKIGNLSKCSLLPTIQEWNDYEDIKIGKFNPVKIVYFGTLIERDNPSVMFEFISELALKINVSLNIVGRFQNNKNGQRWVEEIKNDNRLSDIVNFIGEVNENEKHEILSNADFFILPRRNSLSEIASFPTRLIEYILYRKPIIVSPVGDIVDYFPKGNMVFLEKEKFSISIQRVIALTENEKEYKWLSKENFELGKEKFNSKIQIKQIIEQIENEKYG